MISINSKLLIKGIGASPGRYRGKVYVIKNKDRNVSPIEKEVIVASFISPFDILIVLNAGAIVVERGGVTSHAALIARELGIPCVVAAENATKVLRDGMEVLVDGEEGRVYEWP